MIQSFVEMLNVYLAMFLYYVLQCPYFVTITIIVTVIFVVGRAFILLILLLLKKGFPVVSGGIIRFLQRIVYQISKWIPMLRDICEGMDTALNSWGLWLEVKREKADGGTEKITKKKKSFLKIYVALIIFVCLYLSVPFYMELKVTGEAKEICRNINQTVDRLLLAPIKKYVGQYYIPEIPEADEILEEEGNQEEYLIFHLKKGIISANLRREPEMTEDNIIISISEDVEVVYMHEMRETDGTIWMKVSTEEIPEAWISTAVLDQDELEQAGIYNWEEE